MTQKEGRIEEVHLMPDNVHTMIAIPPEYAMAQGVGYTKGKNAIHLARVYAELLSNFVGQSSIREYIPNQKREDARLEQ